MRIGSAVSLRSLQCERMLDIGCDTGSFLASAARQFAIVPVGIDVSYRAVQEAGSQGIEAYRTVIENAPADLEGFKLITAIDIIEHVTSPAALLREIFSRLCSGGILYLETPNISSILYRIASDVCRLTGGKPRGIFERLFPPQHSQYMSHNGLLLLADTCGFQVVRLDTRRLPFRDISASLPARLGATILQLPDMISGNRILLWAILRRP